MKIISIIDPTKHNLKSTNLPKPPNCIDAAPLNKSFNEYLEADSEWAIDGGACECPKWLKPPASDCEACEIEGTALLAINGAGTRELFRYSAFTLLMIDTYLPVL